MLITILKFAFLFALTPVWLPVLKLIHREMDAALLEEGGLFGRPPTKEELIKLREKYADYEDPLISVPWAAAKEELARSKSSGPGASSGAGRAPSGGSSRRARGSSGPLRTAGGARRSF